MFIPLFSPDDEKILAVLRTKKIPYVEILLLRLVSILIFLGCLIIGLLELFQLQNAAIAFMPFLISGFSDALFLGGLFSIGYLLSQQVIVALMFPLFYYIICLFTGDHYLKSFYLFTLGSSLKDRKLLLLLVGILFIGVSILYQGRVKPISNFRIDTRNKSAH
ncbi:hypothetical protein BAU15_02460 [Enterococcus sp. JM4C]|nr:hypothetical protein BAU15_02460 [Enterococcus sp. JM4C]